MQVLFIDTSVLCNLLRVPGRSADYEDVQRAFTARWEAGVKFVLPITAIIETCNFIAQCGGDRYAAAERFRLALEAAASSDPPWVVHSFEWDEAFIAELLSGDSTDVTLVEHFANRSLGAGDLAILVERDRFARSRSFDDVEIWTLDGALGAYRRS
jgi:hypothetical protein